MLSGKSVPPNLQEKTHLVQKLAELKSDILKLTPEELVIKTGTVLSVSHSGEKSFILKFYGKDFAVTYPDLDIHEATTGKPLGLFQQVLIMYYLSQTDGMPLEGRWISFSELPSGNFYTRAFEGYTGNELAKVFANDVDKFRRTCEKLNGKLSSVGNASFVFDILPNIQILVACWLGDEDFPSSYRILFDASISHHMTTDGCAILGSMLTQKLIATWRSER